MADFFISDTHFHHGNIVRGCSTWDDVSQCRDFTTLAEHDQVLLDNINSRVGKFDILWHLGDWSFGNVANIAKFRNLIHCENVKLLFGNHDHHIEHDRSLQSLFAWTGDMKRLRINGHELVMSHYPFQVWPGNHRGAWMLHGHSHGHVDHQTDGKILDLCPEDHFYTPWSFEEIEAHMSKCEIVAKDHHRVETANR